MITTTSYNDPRLIAALRRGGLAVLRTDTLYGLVASAESQLAVEAIYNLKGRTSSKPLIVLVASTDAVPGISLTTRNIYRQYTDQQPTSIIIPSAGEPDWITRGQGSVAYRVPSHAPLRELLVHSGPLVAPSANPQGLPPARTITRAMDYFGDAVSIYVDTGEVPEAIVASKLIRFDDNRVTVLR